MSYELTSLKIPFGLLNGVLKHVSEVERGLNCDCVCANCGERLVAKKGDKTVHHFAHESKTSCEHAAETAIHLAAKEILEKAKCINLPEVGYHFSDNSVVVCEQVDMQFDRVVIEKNVGEMRPDLIAYYNEIPLIIEIKVTHAVDNKKLKKIRGEGLSAIEINLGKISRECTREELTRAVVDTIDNKKWLYHRRLDALKINLYLLAEDKFLVSKGLPSHVESCPLQDSAWESNKSVTYLINDCFQCDYLLDVIHCKNEEEMDKYGSSPHTIQCLGKYKIKSYNDYKSALIKLRNEQALESLKN